MPRIDVIYTPNLSTKLDVAALVDDLHATVIQTGAFHPNGIRTMALPAEASRIGDGDDRGYVQIDMRIAPGRTPALIQSLLDQFAEVAARHVGSVPHHHVRYQIDLTEFDADHIRRGGDE